MEIIKLSKIASILAFIIGTMAIVAGGKVIIGIMPDYYVIDWLPVYNFSMGLISFFFTAVLIWKNSKYTLAAAVSTLGIHSIVMIILQTAYQGIVAPDSTRAMTLRIITWTIISALILTQSWLTKEARANKVQGQGAHGG